LIAVGFGLLVALIGSIFWIGGMATDRCVIGVQNAVVVIVEYRAPVPPAWSKNPYVYRSYQVAPEWFRFEWREPLGKTPVTGTRTAVPLWAVALIPFTLGGLLLQVGRYRARHGKRGICVNCGYDLNATSSCERCPECGFEVRLDRGSR
jgi:hypothetical protein